MSLKIFSESSELVVLLQPIFVPASKEPRLLVVASTMLSDNLLLDDLLTHISDTIPELFYILSKISWHIVETAHWETSFISHCLSLCRGASKPLRRTCPYLNGLLNIVGLPSLDTFSRQHAALNIYE